MVDLGGYVIIIVETKDKKIKLYGKNKIHIIIIINGLRKLFVAGSPADKDNLEVGDEILEVNGKTLDDATHTEVISHIHQVRFLKDYRIYITLISLDKFYSNPCSSV